MNSHFLFQLEEGTNTNTVSGLKKALQLKPFIFVVHVSNLDLNVAYVKNYNINPELKFNLPLPFLGEKLATSKPFQATKLKDLRR